MAPIIKSGKVVVLLQGRYAGRKAVVVKTYDDGSADRKFPHAVVAGIDRYPRKITKAMDKKKIEKRSLIKPFVKHVNLTHLMPTRYQCDFDLKKVVEEGLKDQSGNGTMRKEVRKVFSEKYLGQSTAKLSEKKATGLNYFYKKLRF
mmetsp:Transcript_92430/g.264072  ORF Transcript_92430/g.264072 Transcript_92430/m.264072 type:complete len:146 (-) Transcript_92430:99-536(-)|eukprot:CAMPEP_0182531546 /NCGR_PEP_ID=MMETSP1323-20130603/9393_1 /TAXON_ID=236787 /ORGANISM="Florenciella parvula, Strain RCC1693" /LENGTH=145 /DNA_ID=CAMNT_0024741119 /DNA_START=30 /DNA_END=467 /DNA_ORIENTATION=+